MRRTNAIYLWTISKYVLICWRNMFTIKKITKTHDEISLIDLICQFDGNYSLFFITKWQKISLLYFHWFLNENSAHFISLTGLRKVEKSHFWMILNLEEITKTKNGSVKGYFLRLGLYNSWWPGQPKSASCNM